MSVDLRFINEHSGFRLWCYRQQGGWASLKLTMPKPTGKGWSRKKYNWWLAWDASAQRLSRRADVKHLQEHHPKIYEWVGRSL